jgi:hypothetical protein
MDKFWQSLEDIGWAKRYGVKNVRKWADKVVKVEDGLTMTRDQRMALYRHSMNEDNWRSLVEGGMGVKNSDTYTANENIRESFRDENGEVDEEAWTKALEKTLEDLSPAEIEFAATPVSNLFDEQGQALAKVHRQLLGYELELEHNYYPKDVMSLVYSSHDYQSKAAIDEFKQRRMRIGVDKGMLHSRLDVRVPIYLNGLTSDVAKSTANAAAYIGLERPMRNAFQTLRHLRHEIIARYGDDLYHEIDKGLRDIIGEQTATEAIDQFLRWVRLQSTIVTLGANIGVMAKQFISFPMYMRLSNLVT